jgi:hypothetical protein
MAANSAVIRSIPQAEHFQDRPNPLGLSESCVYSTSSEDGSGFSLAGKKLDTPVRSRVSLGGPDGIRTRGEASKGLLARPAPRPGCEGAWEGASPRGPSQAPGYSYCSEDLSGCWLSPVKVSSASLISWSPLTPSRDADGPSPLWDGRYRNLLPSRTMPLFGAFQTRVMAVRTASTGFFEFGVQPRRSSSAVISWTVQPVPSFSDRTRRIASAPRG